MDSCFSLLLAWPDQLDAKSTADGSLEQLAILIRLNQLRPAESKTLALIPLLERGGREYVQLLALLAHIRLLQGSLKLCEQVLLEISGLIGPDHWLLRWLKAQLLLQSGQVIQLNQLPLSYWADEKEYPLLALVHIAERLANRDLSVAKFLIEQFQDQDCLEIYRLRAGLYQFQGDPQRAFAELYPILARAPQSLPLFAQAFELVLVAHQFTLILPIAREALRLHGEHPDLLNNVSAVKLHQRQPGYARRSSLLLAAWASLGSTKPGMANQICSYEQCGQADWLNFLHPAIWQQPLVNTDLSANLAVHLASTVSPRYQSHLSVFVKALERSPNHCFRLQSKIQHTAVPKKESLSVAWISGDFKPHPVSRFLHQFLAASQGQRMHHHTLVNLVNHGTQSNLTLFRSLQGVNVADISCLSFPEKVGAIREHGFDVAIDLSGWTGGHFALGFLSRLAPVQVNYLGYFASSGLPTMDYWLGDDVLFREPSPEWCVERRYSLSRPFIAWQPSEQLPEFCVSVTEGPVGSIRFGSFNNNRKLSDQTLRLWGDILTRVPDSRLVLKANAGEDLATQELLARRMHRCGLDPARVEWLQLTVDATDHLLQYRHMDIALDPFPNGGCTTTCEALWMGCPVITLAGMHYVSRMSAAVLEGAGLRSLVAFTELQYVQMAIEQASDLSKLRQTRQRWRDQIKTSPLGNAADLVHHLENALSDMTQR